MWSWQGYDPSLYLIKKELVLIPAFFIARCSQSAGLMIYYMSFIL
jgi:hypothetical protein